ncbi:helix-turn-helix domain-containing protein [Aquimarina sp. Aq107]|uniref:helix-turn-helix domain-containing protein n=1 Tax=Aquimarina sp. Aq107 TaxID=1191912 RepID=UPI000D54F44D|nr:helix-turn-helix transcriptional regulator [Aquimarina sp. Aq107]
MAKKRKEPHPEVLKFGEKIFKLRSKHNMSQMDLGAEVGIDRENIRKYEKGIQEPRLTTIIKFKKVFDVSFDELLG